MAEVEYVLGAYLMENITTGMYKDSRVIFREYIQNACDQIDKAVEQGILESRQDGEIKIYITPKTRTISVEDNATGIPAAKFISTLASIGASEKKIGQDKGFRGIGRLAGLAYCDKLIFTSSSAGENVKSIMVGDATLMRKLIEENSGAGQNVLSKLLQSTFTFSTEKEADTASHYFRVELIGISKESENLLDVENIANYLSFVAPVPYDHNFHLRKGIYAYVAEHGYRLDRYNIFINGEVVVKKYQMEYGAHGQKSDSLKEVIFKEFENSKGEKLAWMWFGRSDFKGAIPDSCPMQSIRIRLANIQIGDASTFQQFFKEARGAKYFVGEVHVLHPGLIPNSQRDYFNENETRAEFEAELRKFATKELNPIYHKGSELNTYLADIKRAEQKRQEISTNQQKCLFVDEAAENKAKEELATLEEKAVSSKKKIENLVNRSQNRVADKIISQLAKDRLDSYQSEARAKEKENKTSTAKVAPKTPARRTDILSEYSKKERKLIERIYTAIKRECEGDSVLTERIIKAIEDELR